MAKNTKLGSLKINKGKEGEQDEQPKNKDKKK